MTVTGDLVVSVFGNPVSAGQVTSSFTMVITPNANGILGCTYANASNYLPVATIDDGSCIYAGCMDPVASNFQIFATTDDGSCSYECERWRGPCMFDANNDGSIGSADLLDFLTAFGVTANESTMKNQMQMSKALITLALFLPTLVHAQSIPIPWNPDSNVDGIVGSADLMAFITVFGAEWMPQELMIEGMPLVQYLDSLQTQTGLPEGTTVGEFLTWDGTSWQLVLPRVGCTLPEACNYDAEAHVLDEDKCVMPDECGVCDGPDAVEECGCSAIPEGACDCEGNVLDALGVCGGGCAADADGDGICDDGEGCPCKMQMSVGCAMVLALFMPVAVSNLLMGIVTRSMVKGAPTCWLATTNLKPSTTMARATLFPALAAPMKRHAISTQTRSQTMAIACTLRSIAIVSTLV